MPLVSGVSMWVSMQGNCLPATLFLSLLSLAFPPPKPSRAAARRRGARAPIGNFSNSKNLGLQGPVMASCGHYRRSPDLGEGLGAPLQTAHACVRLLIVESSGRPLSCGLDETLGEARFDYKVGHPCTVQLCRLLHGSLPSTGLGSSNVWLAGPQAKQERVFLPHDSNRRSVLLWLY